MTVNACILETFTMPNKATIGPYSDAVKAGGFIYLSGRIGLNYTDLQLVKGGIREQTRQCLKNIAEVLALAGCSLDQVIKTTVFLTDMADFAIMNTEYAEVFTKQWPARSTVAVAGLPMGALIEIEVVAVQKTVQG